MVDDDAAGSVGQGKVPTPGAGRFADLTEDLPPAHPLQRPSLPKDQRVVPCGRDDVEERMASGMFQPDGTELEDAPAGERAAYLCLHAFRQMLPRVEQHLPGADWTSLSAGATAELDDLLARLEVVSEAIRAER